MYEVKTEKKVYIPGSFIIHKNLNLTGGSGESYCLKAGHLKMVGYSTPTLLPSLTFPSQKRLEENYPSG